MQLLPVAVFIYGGGDHGSGATEKHYNMTFMVSHAAKVRLPFIGVTFNYRSSIWGFITSQEVFGTGNSNIGLQDQRLALRWIQSNIKAFGGDPDKVTIWGGSSGADSVGFHLMANGGEDERLFRAAILQSGSALTTTEYKGIVSQEIYDKFVTVTSCDNAEDSLECLRRLPFSRLNDAFNDSVEVASPMMTRFGLPTMDGNFIKHYGSLNVKNSRVVKVPIISGVVLNEGSSWIRNNISTWGDLRRHLTGTSFLLHVYLLLTNILKSIVATLWQLLIS
jgi:cholinesterase